MSGENQMAEQDGFRRACRALILRGMSSRDMTLHSAQASHMAAIRSFIYQELIRDYQLNAKYPPKIKLSIEGKELRASVILPLRDLSEFCETFPLKNGLG